MFSRLCEMHLETESDGEQDFLAAFANYNPGKTTHHLCQHTVICQQSNSLFSNLFVSNISSFFLACLFVKVTVQRRIRMNAAVQMVAVSVPTWAPCVNVTQALGRTTPAPAV